MLQIKYHFRRFSKLFSTIKFCNWTTPSIRKKDKQKKNIIIIVKTIHSFFAIRSDSKTGSVCTFNIT